MFVLFQQDLLYQKKKRRIMSISEKRLEEIRNFKNMDFSDCPELTDEQLAQLKPCHIVNSKL